MVFIIGYRKVAKKVQGVDIFINKSLIEANVKRGKVLHRDS